MKKKQTPEKQIEDLLRVEGVDAKGYGIIPRIAMIAPELNCWGKLLYAYLCSLAGSGNQTWPKRQTVLNHLGISKTTYYIAQQNLIQYGYIKVEPTRAGNRRGANIYTLVSSLPTKKRTDETDETAVNRVIVHGLKSGGYGTIPRLVLQDGRICAKTKLVYAYIASYAGNGCSAFPAVTVAVAHLQIAREAWQKAICELCECGYLRVEQRRVKGRFDICDYFLLDKPISQPPKPGKKKQPKKWDTEASPMPEKWDIEKSPIPEKWDIEKSPIPEKWDIEKSPIPEKWDIEKSPIPDLWDIEKWDIENTDTYLINLSTVISNNLSINQSIYPTESTQENAVQDRYDSIQRERETVKNNMKDQLNTNLLKAIQSGKPIDADMLLDVLADTLLSSLSQQDAPQQAFAAHPVKQDTDKQKTEQRAFETVTANEAETARVKAEVKDNISYDELMQMSMKHGYGREDQIDEIVELIAETLCTKRRTIRIGGENVPANMVKRRLRQLDMEHIEYVLDSLSETKTEIHNIRQYLLTALYNAPTTISNYLSTRW